ncbi:hypothetical protein VP01_5686g1, partial [Puccinia sorghi]
TCSSAALILTRRPLPSHWIPLHLTKRPGFQLSSDIINPSVSGQSFPSGNIKPLTLWRPLTLEGQALTMVELLTHCNFSPKDAVPRVLITINQIHHWVFFFKSNIVELTAMGFLLPVACQFLDVAQAL